MIEVEEEERAAGAASNAQFPPNVVILNADFAVWRERGHGRGSMEAAAAFAAAISPAGGVDQVNREPAVMVPPADPGLG
eukprot:CAMPEP_0181325524 /NCGR_PEP_ID=MMETSP1101-20121128/20979_1 /TAXON_ID=46948 /ORGANISM="Rhodomonas abbreviata, Strain Caron Lab Isolate" /LENGTH=78 /DNA_ID=CAMNT_0023433853 /DNA_START=93 /DNA_END=329 /DNA_ORIENTATION=+